MGSLDLSGSSWKASRATSSTSLSKRSSLACWLVLVGSKSASERARRRSSCSVASSCSACPFVSANIQLIDVDPFSARGIVQDYKLGRAHGARDIETEHKLQIPLYILALRDLVGMEPLGGLYRGLTGTREARGLVRADAREDAVPGLKRPDYLSEDDFWHQVDEAQARARRAVDRVHAGDVRTDPRSGSARAGALSGRCARRPPGMRTTPSDQQVAAIDAPGVVFVSADAGTGKTTVLVPLSGSSSRRRATGSASTSVLVPPRTRARCRRTSIAHPRPAASSSERARSRPRFSTARGSRRSTASAIGS